MNPTAIYSKTGKGVQEASGKTSFLSRGDRAILAAIDGKITVQQLGAKFDRAGDDRFIAVLRKMDADGFIREVSPGTVQRGAANAPRSVPSKPAAGGGGAGEDLDFTQIFSAPPKMERPSTAPKMDRPSDPMAAARQEAEMRARQEREARARAQAAAKQTADAAQRERLEAEARAKAAREATMAAAAAGKTRAQIEAEQRAEQEAKLKAEAAARAAAEMAARAQAEAARAKEEAARLAAEREVRDKAMTAERVRFEAAERARREAEELRRKLEDERRAREEAERRAREEAERTRREAEERARREEEERRAKEEAEALRQKLEEERRAREEAERRAEEERQRREQERAEEERRLREEYERQEAERRAREAEERKEAEEHQRQIRLAREAEDRKRRDADARRKKEEEAKRWEAELARRSADEGYRQRAEQEDRERAAREAQEAAERAEAEKRAAEAADQLAGSLLAELDNFSQRQEEERKEHDEQQKRERAAAEQRAREEQARQEQEEAERRARKAEEKRQREDEERRKAEEEAQRRLEEEQRLKEEAIEREKKAREEEARRRARGDVGPAVADLGDDSEGRRLSPEARKALRAREREVARARNRGDIASGKAAAEHRRKASSSLGKSIALLIIFSLILGAGAANLVPLDATEYERAASSATGLPVKVGAARLRVLTGMEYRLERVTVGDVLKVAEVRMVPELGSLFSGQKAYSTITLVNAELKQSALGGALFSSMRAGPLRVARVQTSGLKLDGPVPLPAFDVEASVGPGGRVSSVKLSGERLNGLITPRDKVVGFEVAMASFTPAFAPNLTIVEFGMKGSADGESMTVASFDGRLLEGTVVGSARLQWGQSWDLQGQIHGRVMNAAKFAPQLVAEGRFDGRGRFAMAGADLAKLHESLRLDGTFTVTKGALGAFDLSRALQATSAQASGRTPFTELQGSASYAGGALALREMRLSSGLLRGTGTLDVDPKGALSGRINADLRNLRGTYYIGGTLTDPQLRR